ncbi:Thioredoxin domain-containing protein [Thermovibrio ammonificans HB-1]|uniref:Thioredoxin domain-containing protein n=1 Tax=Thermovibrio ammonificans (strain DSM 15698 / JCM 12110 / HB-1) TaxID=648996 RepID=E8T3R1_THEA1|nr:thioredoxin family protein [Thermovibrio ammonificans]ADU97318.1 Thioredoxin domain-containing protein [Thermovibrio ammonificans HB-1]
MSIPEPLLKVAAIFFDVILVLIVFSLLFVFGIRVYWKWKSSRMKGQEIPLEGEFAKLKKGKGVIYFSAPNCRPCMMVDPVVKKLSKELKRVHFVKVNVAEKPELARKFGILATPTLLIVKDGRIEDGLVGPVTEGVLRERLK